MTQKLLLLLFFLSVVISLSHAQESKVVLQPGSRDTLVVLWTSADPQVAEKVALMYTHAAAKNEWFKKVILIVWGPSANLLAHHNDLQSKITSMISDGIKVQACVVCANSYGVSDRLNELGIEVIGMGKPLTGYLKRGYSQLTF